MRAAHRPGPIAVAKTIFLNRVSWLMFIAFCVLGPIGPARAQDYMSAENDRAVTDPASTDLGYTERADGTLHIEFLLGSFPQRANGEPYDVKIIYDTTGLWTHGGTPPTWGPNGGYATGGTGAGGWNPYGPIATDSIQPGSTVSGECNVNYSWIDPTLTTHYFPIKICLNGSNTSNAFAIDSSGYHMYVDPSGTLAAVYAPDGTLVYDYNYPGDLNVPKDSNGNYITYFNNYPGSLVDTAGRTVLTLTTSGGYVLAVPNSQGTTSTYTLATTQIPVKTYFQQSGVNECTNCTMTVASSIKLPDGASYTFKYDCDSSTGNPACGSPSGQKGYYGGLISISLPTGGQETFTYSIFKDVRGNKDLWVSSRTSAGGTWTYAPSIADLGLTLCGSIWTPGCQQVQMTKPNGDTVVIDYRMDWINNTPSGGAFPVKTYYYTGAPSSANLLETVSDTWDFSRSCPLVSCSGHAYIRKIQEQVTVPVPGGTSVTKQTKWTYDSPQQGNITGVQEWRYLAGTSPTFPSTPDRATYTTYLTTGTNDINRPTSITTCNNSGSSSYCPGGGSMIAQRIITYDSYGSGLTPVSGLSNHDDTNFGASYTTRGNPTQVQEWVSGTTYLMTQLTYDTVGNVLSQKDPAGNITTDSYADRYFNDTGSGVQAYTPPAPTNAYATTITVPIIGAETFGYYYGSGKRAFGTDQNAATTYSHFVDPLDRQTATIYPIGWNLTTYPSATEGDTYVGIGDASSSTGCSSCQHIEDFVDSWGRPISSSLSNNPIGVANAETTYDSNGRVQSVSHAYLGSSPVFETYNYDGLDRTVQATHPDGNRVTVAYGAAVTTAGGIATQLCSTSTYGIGYPNVSVDEVGKKRQLWTDGFGRTIEADEPDSNGNLTLATCYTYIVTDKLASVAQGTETRSFIYDGLNRLTQETTPEAGTVRLSYTTSSGAPCSGNPGNTCQKTDARGVVTTYTYDGLNRLTGKSYSVPNGVAPMPNVCTTVPNNTQANVCYYYDQGGAAAFALGRLTKMVDPSGSETYTYNVGGDVATLQKVVNGTTYTVQYAYNAAGEITSITYPSGRVIQQSYNVIGQLCEVAPQTAACGSSSGPYATSFSYNAAGQTTGFNYGNGVAASLSYSTNRSQLSSLSYVKSGQTLFGLNYWYQQDSTNCPSGTSGNNGQIQCITDGVDSGRSINYSYDSERRLIAATTNGSANFPKWGLGESYDRYGNRWTQTVTAGSGFAVSLGFNNNNQPQGYTYDASGNLTVEPLSPSNNYTYDGEDRLATFSGNGGSATYSYDGHGTRVQKSANGTTTIYIYSGDADIAEYDNGAAPSNPTREYIYADDGGSGPRMLGMVSGGNVNYYHQDHLSTRLITNGNGNKIGEQGHYPFGEAWYRNNTTTQWLFTSYQRDQESGLDYALARYYNSRVAAFCSADPVEGSPEDPQTWNRYEYVRNDPVNMADPNGQFFGFLLPLLGWLLNLLAAIPAALGQTFGAFGNIFVTQVGVESQWIVYPDGALISAGGGPIYGLSGAGYAAIIGGGSAGAAAAAATGAPQALLSSRDQGRFGKAQTQADKDLNNKECQQFLQAHDIDPQQLKDAVQKIQPYNGAQSNITEYDAHTYDPLEGNNSSEAAIDSFKRTTIADSFRFQSTGTTQDAVAEDGGHAVYFRPGNLVSSGGIVAGTLIHEALHNLTAKGDTRLAAQLGLPKGAGSADINPALKAHHCF